MYINHTDYLLNHFNNSINTQSSQIEGSELKIILALSDLLPEPNEFEANFINNSLTYLKENYGLTKSVWKVLLKLNDGVPDFISKLSTWEDLKYIANDGRDALNEYNSHLYQLSIGKYKIHTNNREYHITKLFHFINILCQNFTIEDSTQYVGLFVKDFDTKTSPFSINNLYTQSQYLRATESQDSISYSDINFFMYHFSLLDQAHVSIRELSYTYLDYINPTRAEHKIFFNKNLASALKRLEIPFTEPLKTLTSLVEAYKKYTKENFITYQGLLEIKYKKLEEKDKHILGYLLTALEKSANYNSLKTQLLLELIKLIHSYKTNVVKGLEKRHDIADYISRLENITPLQELCLDNKLNLKTLLTLSKEWETKGISRGEKKLFQNYSIDLERDQYTFIQIKNSHELHEEGQAQGHCVYTYNNDCLEGQTIIVSMKDSKGNRVSTIRLQRQGKISKFFKRKQIWSLAENRKRFNKSCSVEEKAAAKLYFQQIQNKLP